MSDYGSASIQATMVKLLASAAVVGVAASITTLGTWAAFTSTTSADEPASSGELIAELGAAGSAENRLTIGAANIAAGDTIQRQVKLTNSGDIDLSTVTLTTSAAPDASSLLDSDKGTGLRMQVERCSAPWTESGVAPAFTYACGGEQSTLIPWRAVIGTDMPLPGLSSLAAGGSDHLRVTLQLPSFAGNSMQGQSSIIRYSFTAVQRAGTDQ